MYEAHGVRSHMTNAVDMCVCALGMYDGKGSDLIPG